MIDTALRFFNRIGQDVSVLAFKKSVKKLMKSQVNVSTFLKKFKNILEK